MKHPAHWEQSAPDVPIAPPPEGFLEGTALLRSPLRGLPRSLRGILRGTLPFEKPSPRPPRRAADPRRSGSTPSSTISRRPSRSSVRRPSILGSLPSISAPGGHGGGAVRHEVPLAGAGPPPPRRFLVHLRGYFCSSALGPRRPPLDLGPRGPPPGPGAVRNGSGMKAGGEHKAKKKL